jgi:hypothetical protein
MYPFAEYSEYEAAREVVKRLPSVTLKPKPCEDDKGCSNCMYSGRPI